MPVKLAIVNELEVNNEEVIDILDIVTLLMDDTGSGIFCHSLIDDIKMIGINPHLEKLLNEAQKKYFNLLKNLKSRS